jgi:hypothetical protein
MSASASVNPIACHVARSASASATDVPLRIRPHRRGSLSTVRCAPPAIARVLDEIASARRPFFDVVGRHGGATTLPETHCCVAPVDAPEDEALMALLRRSAAPP